ncbi:hypothetical protein KQI69_00045 [Eubacterium sp. MSJ-13]|uniref:hypothetical protein n=1 Tax=Eubacterium sp. MSJ-13 TaxID=2841513 RepID=UPI001C123A34|nr:hypothetical protein [Eubacterium sp. MSJ-13]MBU5477594.1 hypothetical protein [Eubacterium sp. MSJ-13]
MEKEILLRILEKVDQSSNNLEIWIPAIISIVTLLANLVFYIFVQPKLKYRAEARENLTKIAAELLGYLSDIVSFDSFDGVLTKVRKLSLQIHLQFKNGIADKEIEDLLEKIYKEIQKRKDIVDNQEITDWNENFRYYVRKLRIKLAKYCGVL